MDDQKIICKKCGELKPHGDFGRDGKSPCLRCRRIAHKRWRDKNKDTVHANAALWRENNKEKIKESSRKRYVTHREQVINANLKWRSNNKAKVTEIARKWREVNKIRYETLRDIWRQENVDKVRLYRRISEKRRRSDARNRISMNISRSIRTHIKGNKKGACWESIVGFTSDELRRHLEKRFSPGMTWDNYGTFWNIDHIVPISAFNFSSQGDHDFTLCWSLKNLRPLKVSENNKKRARVAIPFQPSLAMGA